MAATKERDKPRVFEIKVNGIQIDNKHQKLTAEEILKLAKDKGAMPGKPEDYELQGDKGVYKADELVDLAEDNVFITLPTAPTPVA